MPRKPSQQASPPAKAAAPRIGLTPEPVHPPRPEKRHPGWTVYEYRMEALHCMSKLQWVIDGCADDIKAIEEFDIAQLAPGQQTRWQRYKEKCYENIVQATQEMKLYERCLADFENSIAEIEASERKESVTQKRTTATRRNH